MTKKISFNGKPLGGFAWGKAAVFGFAAVLSAAMLLAGCKKDGDDDNNSSGNDANAQKLVNDINAIEADAAEVRKNDNGVVYVDLKKSITLTTSLTVPEGTRLYSLMGCSLILANGATLIVEGVVNSNSTIHVTGSDVTINGTGSIGDPTTIDADAKLTLTDVQLTSALRVEGTVVMAGSASISGSMVFTNESAKTMSVYVTEQGDFTMKDDSKVEGTTDNPNGVSSYGVYLVGGTFILNGGTIYGDNEGENSNIFSLAFFGNYENFSAAKFGESSTNCKVGDTSKNAGENILESYTSKDTITATGSGS